MADSINLSEMTDVSIERVVLTFALLGEEVYTDIVSKITEDHFLIPENKILFSAIKELYSSGIKVIKEIDLSLNLSRRGDIDLSGPSNIVSSLFGVLSPEEYDNFPFYITRLEDVYRKRELLEYLNKHTDKIKANIRDENNPFDVCLEDVESGLITQFNYDSNEDPEDIFEVLPEFSDELIEDKCDITGIRTGFPVLDDHIDGLEPGTLTVICAHKKTGKSVCCMNMALNIAIMSELPILYIDTEMSTFKNKTRILANITGIPEKRLKRGDVSDKEIDTIHEVTNKLQGKVKYFHKYVPGFSIDSVLALIKNYHVKYGIGLAVFDYVKAGSSSDFANLKEYQLLGNMTIGLKDLAGNLNIPILTAVQRSRAGDIADSDRIARYADTIMFLESRDPAEIQELGYDYGFYKLIVKHARSGGTTTEKGIGVHFSKPTLKMIEAEKQFDVEDIAPMDEVEVVRDDSDNDNSENGSDKVSMVWG